MTSARLIALWLIVLFSGLGATVSPGASAMAASTRHVTDGDTLAFSEAEVFYDLWFRGDQAELRTVDIYVPEGDGPFPLVVWTHGGGFSSVNPDKGYNVAEFLQANGYVVALVGYRLSPPDQTAFDAAMADYMRALAFLLDQTEPYRIDASRIVLMGHSSGGGMATRAAINPYWLSTIGLSPSDIALCVPIDQAVAWNMERAIPRNRNTASDAAETLYGVTRDNRPEPGYAPVGEALNGAQYPIGTPLYDHPTLLYPDLDGQRHPRNLSVIHDIAADTPRHWIPYSTLSADRPEATAEFVGAMTSAGRPATTLEVNDLNHSSMKSRIGLYSPDGAAQLSNGLLSALSLSTVAGDHDRPSGAALSVTALPNPARGRVRVALGERMYGRVEVLDALGRRVATLADGPVTAELVWDTNGRAPGVYRIRALTARGVQTATVTVVR